MIDKKFRVILASGSPRRRELLGKICDDFEIIKSELPEVVKSNVPSDVVCELADMKATDIAGKITGPSIVIGADTVVSIDGRILGKPKDYEDAVSMITTLSGRAHEVFTGVCIIIKEENGETDKTSFYEMSRVNVIDMDENEIRAYADTKEPMDKAGGYGIQGLFAPFIKGIEGDYYNIVGFPLSHIYTCLKEKGIIL